MLSVEQWPELHEPVMVVQLSGWIDAGLAGSGAIAMLIEQLENAVKLAPNNPITKKNYDAACDLPENP